MSYLVADRCVAQTPRVPVATLDAAHSRRRSAIVVGPLKLPAPDLLAARLAAMTAVGPVARLCLDPSPASTHWRHIDPAGAPRLHSVAPASDPTELLQTVRTLDDRAVTVVAAGQWLAIDFSHGLGEIPLIHTLLDVLFGLTDPADAATWHRYARTPHPLRSAAMKTFAVHPLRVAKLLAAARRQPLMAGNDTGPDAGAYTGFACSPTTRRLGLTAGQLGEMRARRDAALPGVSMVALFTFALHQAFGRTGIRLSETVKIPFDVRRYLPRDKDTLGSFSAGLDFTLDRAGGPAALQRAMTRAGRTGRPVANLLVGTAKARRGSDRRTLDSPAVVPPPQLLHSNLGWAQRNGAWPFTDRRQACMLVASDPASTSGLTVTSVGVAENLWFTAEFHRSVHDPDAVAEALALLPQTVADLTGTD
ncbi:hypothetical protein [Mycolicibacterium neoaurum]|uniref:Diacylglycerol O-acyltransferase n=1 Tax=Mycolicibacterium neoaurum TaxID=1795 RepID=A0AAV2WK30_MYCNE|nr:hypothetical protein [Mycolicibacterium neoaurum]CDQ44123.1 hypothetical protein BN1047_01999 [Mycolicibacterium neoaurum]